MNSELLIELLKVIKQSKQPIMQTFESDISNASFLDFDKVLENIQKQTKKLANSIKKEAQTFNRDYKDEEQMIQAVKSSFDNINLELKELIVIYETIKNKISKDNIQALLSIQVSKKILYDYILWCEKLENALLGIGENEVVFVPNIEIESEIISFIVDSTEVNNLNCWYPFFGGIGLGFLLDD